MLGTNNLKFSLCRFDKPFGGHQRNSNWADAIEDEENHTVSGGGQENKTHIK